MTASAWLRLACGEVLGANLLEDGRHDAIDLGQLHGRRPDLLEVGLVEVLQGDALTRELDVALLR